MSLELICCTEILLQEIADKRFKQRNVAKTYALSIMSSEETDYEKVNKAIIERWSHSGLERIKQLAWRMVNDVAKTKGIKL